MKKAVISLWTSVSPSQTAKKIESEGIFNLFIKMKKTSLKNLKEENLKENPVIKYMAFKQESLFLEIDKIIKKNGGKKARNKSIEFLKGEFNKIQGIFKEFSEAEEGYFVFEKERGSMCFLKSPKDYEILKYFAFNSLKHDIFINVRTKYGRNTYDCIISSKDEKLLKRLKLDRRLNEKLDCQWKFIGNEIKNGIGLKTVQKKLKEEVIFLTIITS